jgi:NarL family two-component system response regulator LiaR
LRDAGAVAMLRGVPDAPIRLLIVDDHDLFRTGLAALLSSEPDLEVVAQASGGRAAIRLARELRPNVILMDLRMPDCSGQEATDTITRADPNVQVVVLSVAADEATVASAIRAGASGYLVKDSPISEVAAAVRAAARGTPWLSSRAAQALLDRVRHERSSSGPDPAELAALTAREQDVLRLLARGLENAEIASALHISARTAKNHVSSIPRQAPPAQPRAGGGVRGPARTSLRFCGSTNPSASGALAPESVRARSSARADRSSSI